MTSQITDDGITLDRYDDQVASMVAAAKGLWGEGINTDEDQLLGHQIRQIAYIFAQLADVLYAIYNSKSVRNARGIRVDHLLELIGIYRRAEAYSRAELTYTVDRAVTIPAGHQVRTAEQTYFATEQPLMFLGAGSAKVWAACTTPGEIAAAAGAISVPVTRIPGVVTVENEAEATLGRLRETDAELKRRHTLAVATSGNNDVASMYEALYAIQGVSSVYIAEDLDAVSLSVSVVGGTDDEIAAAIDNNLTVGVRTLGDTLVSRYNTTTRQTRDIWFTRAVDVPVYLRYVITVNPALYPSDGDDQIKAAILNVWDYQIKDTVSYLGQVGPVYTIPGVIINEYYMGLSDPAAGAVDLPMTAGQRGTLAIADIEIERA